MVGGVTLLEFIEARLAEDEAWAFAASQPYEYAAESATVPAGGVHWTWVVGEDWTPITPDPAVDDKVGGPEHYGCSVNLASVEEWPNQGSDHGWPVRMMRRTVAHSMVEVDSSAAGHIARHDPARVLRDVEATRAVLRMREAMALGLEAADGTLLAGAARARLGAYDNVLRAFATAWRDHPDYDPTWSPS